MTKRALFFLASMSLVAVSALGQPAAVPASAPRTDLYSVYFVKAAPGKSAELLASIRQPGTGSPMPTHALILKHVDGDDWDFVVVEHLGPKITLDATSPLAPAGERELRAWHYDTYATGPSWEVFAKAMGIGSAQAGAAPATSEVYVLGDYRGAPGHRAQLEDTLKRVAASSLRPADTVMLQHREGSAWDYLFLTRYNGFKDYAFQQEDPDAEARTKKAGLLPDPGLALREHVASHHDTIAVRVPVQAGK